MDHKHKLEAPDNESLKTIEQVESHSELTTLYPLAKDQWDGTIMSSEERATKHDADQDRATRSIRKLFLKIGTLAPLPFLLAALIVATAFTIVTEDNAAVLVFPMIFMLFIWLGISYVAIRNVYRMFYSHALRATPFLIALYIILGLGAQVFLALLIPMHIESILINIAAVCAGIFVLSIIVTALLLFIWTAHNISGQVKLVVIAGVIAILSVGTFALTVL